MTRRPKTAAGCARCVWCRVKERFGSIPSRGNRLNIAGVIVLPCYLGLTYALGDPRRFGGQAFAEAQAIASMRTWGVLFILLAAVIAGCVLWSNAAAMKALVAATFLYLCWGCLFVLAALEDPPASSFSSGGLYAFIAWSHFASAQTLSRELSAGRHVP